MALPNLFYTSIFKQISLEALDRPVPGQNVPVLQSALEKAIVSDFSEFVQVLQGNFSIFTFSKKQFFSEASQHQLPTVRLQLAEMARGVSLPIRFPQDEFRCHYL